MPVDPGRPQAASPSRTAQRASGSRSPAAAQSRVRRPSEPTRPQGSQSRERAERPLRASVHPASARRARRPPQQTRDGAEESGAPRGRLDASRYGDPSPAAHSQPPQTRAHRRPYLTCDAPRLPAHRPDRLCTPEVTSATGPAPAPGGRCGSRPEATLPRASWAAVLLKVSRGFQPLPALCRRSRLLD